MLDQGGGTIVNVASVNSFLNPDGFVIDYGAAKAALLNVAKGALAGARPERNPHQQHFACTGRDRPLARRWLSVSVIVP
jgi:hypothetical protein